MKPVEFLPVFAVWVVTVKVNTIWVIERILWQVMTDLNNVCVELTDEENWESFGQEQSASHLLILI